MSRCYPYPPPWYEPHDSALFKIFKLPDEMYEMKRSERRRKKKKERMLEKLKKLKEKRKREKLGERTSTSHGSHYGKKLVLRKRKSNQQEFMENLVLDMSKRCKI